MKVLLVDNYDSFTYNLFQMLSALGASVVVRRNDAVSVPDARRMEPSHIVLSPGPGRPEGAGACLELIQRLGPRIPLLGVCLGHQALACALGGRVTRTKRLLHGKLSVISHDGRGVFRGLPGALRVVRYHSLAVERPGLPRELVVTAESDDGVVMGLRHRRWPAHGVQFHPESFQTESGAEMLKNFLRMRRCS
ncbi:MAG: aminodeoxychorismate/anthranilate synthase component II [Elusimicrobia bacterium GWA2_69_24]|nr:MAG: aminodeoxychorismate/anthranilate synthase component II [Elusimicrobia bacterium GWA2_69_24]HBL17353.1 aminodeoxychorismate/anthranilate synthase component II [Elusimicrobiota bacterium]